jgi:hypothetical protein
MASADSKDTKAGEKPKPVPVPFHKAAFDPLMNPGTEFKFVEKPVPTQAPVKNVPKRIGAPPAEVLLCSAASTTHNVFADVPTH